MLFADYFKIIILLFLLILASYEDLRSKTIPNRLIAFGCISGTIAVLLYMDMSLAFDALIGFLAGGGILLLIAYISKGGIGMGDVKLMGCAGIFLGLGKTLGVLMMAIICSGIVGAVLLLIKKSDKKETIPFAPFILLGTLIVYLQNFG